MLKGSTVKEVNVCFVDKWFHSSSLINVQPEENGMSSYGNTIPRNFDEWFGMLRKTFRIEELQCCSDVEVLVCKAIRKKNVQVLVAKNDDALGVGRWAWRVGRWAWRVGRWAWRVGRDALGVTRCVKVPEKKSAWTDLDRVDFEKIFKESMFKSKNRRGQV